jgi:predicted RNase H-like HicB family nuclease
MAVPLEFTAVFRKVPEGYIASVEELPGANTQGRTLEEARENLREAVVLVIEANRALAREREAGRSHSRVSAAGKASPPSARRAFEDE